METWPLLFVFGRLLSVVAKFTGPIVERNTELRKDDYMLWIGVAFVLIGVFLIGKSSN